MDKQKLRKMPTQPAPSWMTEEAARAKLQRNAIERWYADVERNDEVITLRIYERSKLLGGTAFKENYRIFLDLENRAYISLQMDLTPPKCWRSGRINSVLARSDIWCIPEFEYEPGYVKNGFTPYLTFDTAGMDTLEKALGPLEGSETWGLRIYRWQDKILKEELVRHHNKELEPVVELMKQVPELPDGFYDWLCTEGVARFDYAIYDPPKGRKETRIQCTRCGAKMMVDVKKIHPVRDKRGICPKCGRPVTWKTVSSKVNIRNTYWGGLQDPWYVSIIQRMGKGLVVRTFYTYLEFIFSYGTCTDRRISYGEVARDVFPDIHSTAYESFERIRYKNQGDLRWAPSIGEYRTHKAFLYTDNLPDVLSGTAWQYSGLKEYQQKAWPGRIPICCYMRAYPKKPQLEYFSKMGLVHLVEDELSSWSFGDRTMCHKGVKPEEILGIKKQDIKTLVRLNGGHTILSLLRSANRLQIRLSDNELLHYKALFSSDAQMLRPERIEGRDIDIHKRMKYFRKQAEKSFNRELWNKRYTKAEAILQLEKNLWRDWEDYIAWLGEFMPECMTDEYYVLPPDLPKAHDRLMAMATAKKEREVAARLRRQEEAVAKILAEAQQCEGIAMQARGLLIRLPKDADEIRREGEIQHHCVATYIDRVAQGKTMILFVRQVDDPDTPFYTMEFKDGHVAQCRGRRNAGMTPAVKTFVDAFERKMQASEEAGKVRQKVMVTA